MFLGGRDYNVSTRSDPKAEADNTAFVDHFGSYAEFHATPIHYPEGPSSYIVDT